MKKLLCGVVTLVLGLSLSACSLQCLSGHTWEEATCTTPKTCSVCGKTDGERLSPDGAHQWEEATCTEPKTCKVCGETEGYSLEHDYNAKGECERCGAHKEYGNAYGYFSKSELQSMATDAIENAVYPVYVSDFDYSNGYIEKITDEKMMVGQDSFTVVGAAEFSSNGTVSVRRFVVIVEPRSSTKYVCKDYYVE